MKGFSKFWEAYPRKSARLAAITEWQKINYSEEFLVEILAAIESQKQTEAWKRGVILNPDKWLRDQRWTDEVSKNGNSTDSTFADKVKAAREKRDRERKEQT